MRSVVNYPAAQIAATGSSMGPLSTTSTAVSTPLGGAGSKPAFFRIAISAGSAHVRLGSATSVTAVTSDTIVNASEALWINSLGYGAIAARQTVASAGTAGVTLVITPLEEGALRVPTSDGSGLG